MWDICTYKGMFTNTARFYESEEKKYENIFDFCYFAIFPHMGSGYPMRNNFKRDFSVFNAMFLFGSPELHAAESKIRFFKVMGLKNWSSLISDKLIINVRGVIYKGQNSSSIRFVD
jgi:hypothetical protein